MKTVWFCFDDGATIEIQAGRHENRDSKPNMDIETLDFEGYKIRIVRDEDPMNPREWDNLGEILYTSSRYTLGDRQTTSEEIQSIIDDKNNIVLPVYAYIHGNTLLSTSPFNDPWDSGLCGIIYVSKDKVREEWKKKLISAKLRNTVIDGLKSEVKTYGAYIAGEVFGYIVEIESDSREDNEFVDSCFGFYDLDDAIENAKAACTHRKLVMPWGPRETMREEPTVSPENILREFGLT